MQALIDSGKVIELAPNTKALVTAYEKGGDQAHIHVQSGSAVNKDLLVMHNFVKP